jgi:hypothetical protein
MFRRKFREAKAHHRPAERTRTKDRTKQGTQPTPAQSAQGAARPRTAQPTPAQSAQGAARPRTAQPTPAQRVEYQATKGAVQGNHNLQINDFVVRADRSHVDFEQALRRPSVIRAVRALQREPVDPARRADVVRELSRAGWLAESRPRTVQVRRRADDLLSWIGDMITFGVEGLQVGDHNRQRNRFDYCVTSLPTGSRLLQHNQGLARALTDRIVPVPGASPSVETLDGAIAREVENLDISWRDGVNRGQVVVPGELGEVVRIRRTHGVTVGHGNRQVNRESIEVSSLQVGKPSAH